MLKLQVFMHKIVAERTIRTASGSEVDSARIGTKSDISDYSTDSFVDGKRWFLWG